MRRLIILGLIVIGLLIAEFLAVRVQQSIPILPTNVERITAVNADRLTRLATLEPVGGGFGGHGVAFSADGMRFGAEYANGAIRLWDANTGLFLSDLSSPYMMDLRLWAFSPDGTRIAVVYESTFYGIFLIDAQDGTKQNELVGHDGLIWSAEFSPDGTLLVSTGEDRTIRLWDTETGASLAVLRDHTDAVSDAAFSPDGTLLASASKDHTIRLWDVAAREYKEILADYGQPLARLLFSPDGKLLVVWGYSAQGPIWLLDATTGERVATLTGHSDRVTGAAFSPEGSLLASASWDGAGIIWDMATLSPIGQPLYIGGDLVRSVVFSPDGRLLVSNSLNTVQLWGIPANH